MVKYLLRIEELEATRALITVQLEPLNEQLHPSDYAIERLNKQIAATHNGRADFGGHAKSERRVLFRRLDELLENAELRVLRTERNNLKARSRTAEREIKRLRQLVGGERRRVARKAA
jgi:uncharacterized coiled-coil protein SlyX